MNDRILIKQCGIDNYQWLSIDSDDQQVYTGDGEALAQACPADARLLLIAATQQVSLAEVGFEAHEKKMLRQTIPFTLEDNLLDDVEDLHFALGAVQQQRVAVAWLKKQTLQQWLNEFESLALEIQQVLPELLLLPCQDDHWTLVIDDDRWLLKSAAYRGFSLEVANASLALQLLLDDSGQVPLSVDIYAGGKEQAFILSQLPELLRGVVTWCEQDYWQLMKAGVSDDSDQSSRLLNLLQGAYERKLPWKKWWKTWQVAAMLLLAATVLQFVASLSQLKSLENTSLALRTEIEQVYRTVIPRGAIVNPEKQLTRKVRALESGGNGGFVALLDKIAQVVAQTQGLSIQSLNYTEKQSEVRLSVIADGFNDVETARANMEKLGLTAKLTGSSSDNGKTRARLHIKS